MTIEKILDTIYSFEAVVETFPKEKDEELKKYLPCITKLIAMFDLAEEISNTDEREFDDDKLKTYRDVLHNALLDADRELFKRNLL